MTGSQEVPKLLEPVVETMKSSILESNKIHADETTLKVQTDNGLSNSYLWGYLAKKQVVF